MQDEKKNREMRCETRKKWRDETQDKKKQGDEMQDKKNVKTRPGQKKSGDKS